MINSYAEDEYKPTDTVYGYVPMEIVEQLIKKHGGIDFELSIKKHVDKYNKAGISTPYSKLYQER